MDRATRLDIDGPELADFHGLRIEGSDGHSVGVYAPAEIQRALQEAGLPAASRYQELRPVPDAIVELVGKVARLFERANIVSFENDFERKRLVRDSLWPLVYTGFLESGVLKKRSFGRPVGAGQPLSA
jgi:hypothetical protein